MCMGSKHEKHDWESIQLEYDNNQTITQLMTKFAISLRGMRWGRLNGKLKIRNKSLEGILRCKEHPRKHSIETRKKISDARRKYLADHPDMVPYRLNHSSKQSYPEKLFETALRSNDISGWISPYRIYIYEYDFAFPELKIDVEIDGGTHSLPNVIEIDIRRDAWSKSRGWTVIRFPATRVKSDIGSCIEELKHILPPKL